MHPGFILEAFSEQESLLHTKQGGHDWFLIYNYFFSPTSGTQSPMANDLIIHAYLMNLDND